MPAPPAFDPRRRSDRTEWLDRSDRDPRELAAELRDLSRFDRAMFGYRPILAWLEQTMHAAPGERTPTVLDVGCGHGDLLRAIRKRARKRAVDVRLIGLDRSHETIRIAQSATAPADAIDYWTGDVFGFVPPEPVDFVVSSLFAHHLTDKEIVSFLRWMESTARRGWLICDLQRHAVPYHFIGLAGKLTPLDRAVIHDGRISVARSLTRAEWLELIDRAGIGRTSVALRSFLFRHVIGRLK
jgi:SAM-dependent methyltransferase